MKGPRRPGELEFMGAYEAAAALDVLQPNLRTVAGLPEPYMKLKATPLWRADDIRALAQDIQARRARRQARLHPGPVSQPCEVTA